MSRSLFAATALCLVAARWTHATIQDPKVLPTPPMGFNDWSRFQCNISEELFVRTADAMASNGMLKAGYDRINIDDCWPSGRSANGSLEWNTTIFPKGLPWLADYVASKGFHLGIYSDAGNVTCGKFVGSLGYEAQDAATFKSWGIDYLKLDGCNVYAAPGQTLEERYYEIYHHWHEVLADMSHPLIFSQSAPAYFSQDYGSDGTNFTNWYTVMDWVPVNGELARHSDDIAEYKYRPDPWNSVLRNYDQEVRLARVQAPGYYNDPDFLVVDEPALTLDEHRSHFALWAMFSAPLIVSAYVPDLDRSTIDYLTNSRLIAVDQDSLALQATLVSRVNLTSDVLSKSLANGERAVAILNNGTLPLDYTVPVARLGWTSTQGCSIVATNLWSGKTSTIDACKPGAALSGTLATHATDAYTLKPAKQAAWTPTGAIFNAENLDCLTAESDGAKFSLCDSSDAQIWQVGKNGSYIKSLETEMCLSGSVDGSLAMTQCSDDSPSTFFQYSSSGNIRFNGTQCITEATDGKAILQVCQYLTNSQVFEIPSGWQV